MKWSNDSKKSFGCFALSVLILGHLMVHTKTIKETKISKGVDFMKGYATADGYMGYIDGEYQFFATEADYRDYLED